MFLDIFKRKLIKDTSFLTATSYCNQFFQFIRGFVIAKMLDPALFGYLSGARLVLQVTPQMHLGALHGFGRYLSLHKSEKDADQYKENIHKSTSFIVLISAAISLGIIAVTYILEERYSSYTIWCVRIFALIALIQQISSVFQALLRAEYDFKSISVGEILLGAGSLILSVILVWWVGLYGAVTAFLISNILSMYYLFSKSKYKFKLIIDWTFIKQLIVVGAPISFFYFNRSLLDSIDKLIIINFLSVEQLGFYAIALPFFNLITKIPASLSYIMYPRMLEAYGKNNGNIQSTRKYFEIPTLINAIICAFAVGILFLSIKYIFVYLLPRYVEAIPVARILSITVYFSCLNSLAVRVLITDKNYKMLFIFQMAAIVTNVLLNYLFVRSGYGIVGVATATCISYVLYSSLVLQFTLTRYHPRAASLVEQAKLIMPLLFVSIVIYAMWNLEFLSMDLINNITSDLITLSLNLMLFSLCTLPLFYFLNYKKIKQLL